MKKINLLDSLPLEIALGSLVENSTWHSLWQYIKRSDLDTILSPYGGTMFNALYTTIIFKLNCYEKNQ